MQQKVISREDAVGILANRFDNVVNMGAHAPKFMRGRSLPGDKRRPGANYDIAPAPCNRIGIEDIEARALAAIPPADVVKLWLVDTGRASDLVAHIEDHCRPADNITTS